jgi:hypothetical protein
MRMQLLPRTGEISARAPTVEAKYGPYDHGMKKRPEPQGIPAVHVKRLSDYI